ncbi:MAG TPA: hypothetical protein VFR75_03140, partial [Solirubrobacterales bacterium]|nr:hypothetical protein [Solirubrobacterales bacterium]
KRLSLLATGAVALMAFSGAASATTITGPSGESTPTIHAENSGGHIVIQNPIANISCASTFEGAFEAHGSGWTAKASFSGFTFTGCTNGWHVTVIAPGGKELHYVSPGVATSTQVGITFDVTRFGVTCIYSTGNTDFGTYTDSTRTGGRTKFHFVGVYGIHSGSSGLCGTGPAKVEGSYETTQNLFIDP